MVMNLSLINEVLKSDDEYMKERYPHIADLRARTLGKPKRKPCCRTWAKPKPKPDTETKTEKKNEAETPCK